MWTCQNCGSVNNNEGSFCEHCGKRADATPKPNPQAYSQQPAKQNNAALIVIISVLSVLLVCLGAYVLITTFKRPASLSVLNTSGESNMVVQGSLDAPSASFNIEPINGIIRNYSAQNNICVSVCDLTTGEIYEGNRARTVSVSTGFYIPIYLQAESLISQGKLSEYEVIYPSSNVYFGGTGTLKKDAAISGQYDLGDYIDAMMYNMDNGAANTIIDRIGGFPVFNSNLASMGYPDTSYNRQFGVSSTNDNFTSAADACRALSALYSQGGKKYLNASASSYGITLPHSCNTYAHFGRIDKLLNAYVIIETPDKAYGVAVLTTGLNGASNLISDILFEVRNNM